MCTYGCFCSDDASGSESRSLSALARGVEVGVGDDSAAAVGRVVVLLHGSVRPAGELNKLEKSSNSSDSSGSTTKLGVKNKAKMTYSAAAASGGVAAAAAAAAGRCACR